MDTSMKMVAWNCNGAFRKKIDALLQLAPDIAVVPEALQTCLTALNGRANSSVWAGSTNSKGLAVCSFNGWELKKAGPEVSENWFVPAIASKGNLAIQVVGVWVKPASGYVRPTLNALKALEKFAAAGPTIFLGDFNQNVVFDKAKEPGARFADVVDVFERLQMVSAWHGWRGEPHGAESRPTSALDVAVGPTIPRGLRVSAKALRDDIRCPDWKV
jgi:hypothetical protein